MRRADPSSQGAARRWGHPFVSRQSSRGFPADLSSALREHECSHLKGKNPAVSSVTDAKLGAGAAPAALPGGYA